VILGIETSCDETAIAVIQDGRRILSNVVSSQVELHARYGGVVPELASRQHIRDICGVVERAFADAGATWSDLGAIAVTQGPGLVGSLLVGVAFAKAAAAAANLPVVAVHHLAGHIESLILENGELPLPSVVLVVSGGHTSLYLVDRPGNYQLLSRTRDDAAGEAYDKVAKLLGLGYPGGPIVDRLARNGDDRAVPLPTTRLTHADRNAPHLKGDLDFSFSGLKTAILRYVRLREAERAARPLFTEQEIADICASFQRVVVTTLIDRAFDAARRHQAKSIGVAGGVSANSRLRAELQRHGELREMPIYLPSLQHWPSDGLKCMTVFTDYLWFNTKKRQEFIRITDEVAAIVKQSGVNEGMALVSAMHITAGVYVNDWEDGLIHDFQEWLEKLAPAGRPYRHHQTGEDNADAHLKRTIMGHQVVVPITGGKLDLGPWEQVFYAEFDGQRKKRVVVKVIGT
jgi:N6-L-threonylcarbamoyladenine synthase